MRSGNDLPDYQFHGNLSISFFIFVVTLGGDGLEPSCLDFFTVLVLSSDARFFRSLAAPLPLLLLLACKEHIQIHSFHLFKHTCMVHEQLPYICINKFILITGMNEWHACSDLTDTISGSCLLVSARLLDLRYGCTDDVDSAVDLL